ncbi:hypothetical protein L7F22_015717 [Adiantum nelumboides]|nr:hypothetical protein [Adiantum nelumboides]
MANMAFPTFHGRSDKDAIDFRDNLEVACVVSKRDNDVSHLRLFPLLLKAEARTWYYTLLPAVRADWGGLRMAFMQRFGAWETSEKLWERLCELRLVNVFEYGEYELQFTNLWEKWVATLAIGESTLDFLKRDCFVDGLCPPLKDKVKTRFPITFETAREVAHLKERKLRASASPEQGRGQRRQPQNYHCYNCGEEGHQMYFCPYPRRNANYRGPRQQVSPPRGRQQQLYQPPIPMQQAPPVQILRPPQQQQPPPPPIPIPPLSPVPENRAISIISLDEENEQQFGEVKEILSSLPTIAPPKWEETFYVNPSVGGDSIGVVLMQKDDSFMRPIYFISRMMTTAEKDYTMVEHMVMALMFAVGKFRPYLLPKKFVILTLVEKSTRASLAGLLTHRCYEKKLKVKPTMVKVEEEVSKFGEAHSLYFDDAYKRKVDKAVVGVVIYDEEGRKVFGKGLMLENVHSNNEPEYAALSLGLEWCLNLGIKRLNAFGDALLLVKQVHGTWACRNQGLAVQLRRVKELLERFEVADLLHVPRKDNQEADALASEKLQDVTIGAVALQQPQFQGSDCMLDILHFLETDECLEELSKGERQWLERKATKFRLINDDLY